MNLVTRSCVRLVLAASLLLAAASPAAQAAGPGSFGIASADAELSTLQAGAHPDFTTDIEFATDPTSPLGPTGLHKPYGLVSNIKVNLPPGLLANLNAVTTCSAVTFVGAPVTEEGCPLSSQVGVTLLHVYELNNVQTVPIYSLETSENSVARLGFYVQAVPVFIEANLRSNSDYGVTATVAGVSSIARVASVRTTLWGVPADSSHDTQRLTVSESVNGKSSSPPRPFGRSPEPFMTNPTTCGQPLSVDFAADSYEELGNFREASAPLGEISGCPKLEFNPSFSLTPTTREAAAPSGADVTLSIPQNEAVNGYATAQLRDTVVKLPEGLTIAAGAADGLAACSDAQVGFGTVEAAHCPEASKIASAEIDSPSLSRPLSAAVYQRTPEPGRLTRAWLVADDLGVHVKIPGEFQLDPRTGQITSLFLETPQVPVRTFTLHFKSGARGVLATPARCGNYGTAYRLTPWSGGAPAEGVASMTIDARCNTGGFDPELSAGTVNPTAGAYSPFVTDLRSEAGEQNLSGLDVTLPPGVLAKLAGVTVCPEANAADASCPSDSQVGTTSVATGPGPSPLWIPQPGKAPTAVYLAGPHRGGPYSLLVKTPAQAGPFDLGTVVVRAAIHVDPESARVSVASDPLPQFLEGIPVSYRDVHVDVSRSGFALNPTSCAPLEVGGTARSIAGATASLSDRFQVGDCAGLSFRPKLALRLKGGTKRGAHPALRATLTMPAGGANIAGARVGLPHSEFLENSHIRTICTRVQFAAEKCPAEAVYGRARAFTPLLDRPLEGPVYLRSSSHKLPDLVADLRGQIHVVLVGRIDSVNGGIRSTFESVPDAPVSKFVLEMQGGRKGLLVNSTNLCAKANFAGVSFKAQNAKTAALHPQLAAPCPKAKPASKRAGRHGQR